MKILLLGEFSNLHWTLAEGLRKLGHEVCVVSNGDRWRNYQRDISLTRQSDSILDGIQGPARSGYRHHRQVEQLPPSPIYGCHR